MEREKILALIKKRFCKNKIFRTHRGVLVSGPAYKELRSHRSHSPSKKKAEQNENQPVFLDPP